MDHKYTDITAVRSEKQRVFARAILGHMYYIQQRANFCLSLFFSCNSISSLHVILISSWGNRSNMLRGQGAQTERTSSAPACLRWGIRRPTPPTASYPRSTSSAAPPQAADVRRPLPLSPTKPLWPIPFRHWALPTRATGMWSPPASTTREINEIRDYYQCASEKNSIFATPDLDSKHVIPDFRVFLCRFAPCFFTNYALPKNTSQLTC